MFGALQMSGAIRHWRQHPRAPLSRFSMGAAAAVVLALLAAGPARGSSYVYVAKLDGTISQYKITPSGTLKSLSPAVVGIPGSGELADVTVSEGGKWLYASGTFDNGAGIRQYDLGLGGLLSAMSPPVFLGQGGGPVVEWESLLYVANPGRGTVSILTRDQNGEVRRAAEGRVTGKRPWGLVGSPGIHAGPLYVVSRDSDTVSLSLPKPDTGDPYTQTLATGLAPFAAVATANANALYVTNTASNSVSQYTIAINGGPDAGHLSAMSPASVATGAAPMGLALSPDGRFLYVANQTSDTISRYAVAAKTGLLSKVDEVGVPGDGPTALAFSPDGRSLYVTNMFSVDISQLGVGADGKLTRLSPATVALGGQPSAIAISPEIPTRVGRAVRVTARRTVRVNRRGFAAIPVRCPTRLDRCRVRVQVRSGGRVLARGRVTVRGGRSAAARVRLSRGALRMLERRGRLRVGVLARSRHAAGNRSHHAIHVILRRA